VWRIKEFMPYTQWWVAYLHNIFSWQINCLMWLLQVFHHGWVCRLSTYGCWYFSHDLTKWVLSVLYFTQDCLIESDIVQWQRWKGIHRRDAHLKNDRYNQPVCTAWNVFCWLLGRTFPVSSLPTVLLASRSLHWPCAGMLCSLWPSAGTIF